jgi:glycosyltransferase involved in cell wall biosynthesis
MPHAPRVSIVVCTYNRAPSLVETLEALDAQITPADLRWELIVVDNNSTDATREAIERFAARARIRVRSVFEPSQGLSHARNAGVAHAAGGVVGFTDDDVQPAPDWVASVAAAIGAGADIVGGRILPRWRRPPPPWLEHRPYFRRALAIMDDASPALVRDPRATPSVWGANMAFRREVFDAVGLFDSRRGMVGTKLYRGEEIDLVQRAIDAGFRVIYDPTVVVWHRIEAERMRLRYVSRLHFQQAEGEALLRDGRSGPRPASLAWRRADTIERWLHCCGALGAMWGACKLYLGRRR